MPSLDRLAPGQRGTVIAVCVRFLLSSDGLTELVVDGKVARDDVLAGRVERVSEAPPRRAAP